jgi:hypothetical protein
VTGRWILAQDADANARRFNSALEQIREVEHLAAERAWGHAVAPGRLTGSARANLTQYAQLVSSLGKGTGKYAAKRRAEITEAMERCRPSVPVWIMPIYRIAEQVRVQPNLYDVVIVDEASQAGLEASFLQYLAAKIVVIGDDKQVSPSAVGVDQQQLRDLANMYLATDPYRASWLDPKRSYFDEANMRFGGRITLTEHRRCVPEIIGFSNRVAYEPEGIRLVPVRQFGAERLDPIKVVHLAEGYEADNKTNPVEADAIVDQIRKCLAEPQYDGATFGVISLLGKEQAKLIEHKLTEAGFEKTTLLITHGKSRKGLFERVAHSSKASAGLFLSVHHDSVPDKFLEKWQFEGEEHGFSDRFKGHSIFVSHDNGDYRGSLVFARLLGNQLKARGLKYTPHYTEKFMGHRQRQLVDAEAGVYRYDQLIVLKN